MKFKRFITLFLVISIIVSSASFVTSAAPTLKDGNYTEWIDRVDELPSYATDLYLWLEDNAKEGGALRTGITDTLLPDSTSDYVHLVETVVGDDKSFSYQSGADSNAKFDLLRALCAEDIKVAKNDVNAYIYTVFAAFNRDHPEVFWLSGTVSVSTITYYSFTDNESAKTATGYFKLEIYILIKTADFDIRHSNYSTSDIIDETVLSLENRINTILSGDYPSSGSYEDKVKYFNSVLTKTNCYNTSSNLNNIDFSCRNCTSALFGNVGTNGPVCESYAKAFKVLCDRVGIPCVLVDGTANSGSSSGGHMWNYVQMENGKWYAMDVTWNDPSVDGVTGQVSGYENEKYFLVGSDTVINELSFIDSHPVTNCVFYDGLNFTNGPELSKNSYAIDMEAEEEEVVAKITGASLLIGSELSIAYYCTIPNGYNDVYLKVNCANNISYITGKSIDSQTKYSFVFPIASPNQMGVSFSAELYSGDVLLDSVDDYSVLKYCQSMANKDISDEFRQLLADILEYGAMSQLYSSYCVDDLVNNKISNLTPTKFEEFTNEDFYLSESSSDNVCFKSASVSCGDKNSIILTFVTDDISKIKLAVNNMLIEPKDYICVDAVEGLYSLKTYGMAPTDFGEILTFDIYENNDIVQKLQYSINSYLFKKQSVVDQEGNLTDMANLARALYNYGQSSVAYVNSISA